jgi:hypothetical protein
MTMTISVAKMRRRLLHDFLDSLTETDFDDLRGATVNEEHEVIERIVDAYLANAAHRERLTGAAARRRR